VPQQAGRQRQQGREAGRLLRRGVLQQRAEQEQQLVLRRLGPGALAQRGPLLDGDVLVDRLLPRVEVERAAEPAPVG
jgi:hypothetical protein